MLLFTTRSYAYLVDPLLALGSATLGSVVHQQFPDGERYQRIATPVEGECVVLVGGTISDEDTLELFDLACALVKYGARQLRLVIPYFGYSTMERAIKSGEVVTAKTRARLLSAIPLAPEGNRVFMVDLHAEGIPHYFEGGIRPVHLYAKELVCALARKMGGNDFVLACTDAGRAKWVESLANDLRVPASFVFKRRLDGSHTEVTAVSAQVQGKRVVIYDDMIRTGGSLLSAARAYRDAGAASVVAITTHGLFPGDALNKIRAAGLIEHIACTDSHPRPRSLACDYLHVEPIAPVLRPALVP
jgi:ribose-phosphate pyrophosphokinase